MLTDLFEIIVNYFQYFTFILQTKGVDFPESWSSSGDVFSLVNLDLAFFRDQTELVPQDLDVRLYFIAVAIGLPLLLVFAGLFVLNSKVVIAWYFALLAGVTLTGAGMVGFLIDESDKFKPDRDVAEQMLVLGVAMTCVCLILLMIRKTAGCCMDSASKVKDTKGLTVEEIIEIETESCEITSSVEYLGIVVGLMIVGLIFVDVMPPESLALDKLGITDTSLAGFTSVVGWVLIALAVLIFLWLFMSFSRKGRELQWRWSQFVSNNFMKILMIVMSIAYMPVGSAVFLMFNCNSFDCDGGSRLVDHRSLIAINESVKGDACTTCNIAPNQVCPASLQSDMCGGGSDLRIEYDLGIACTSIRVFYWPASAVVFVSFIIGVPILFFKLIERSSVGVQDTIPYDTRIEDPTEIWAAKVIATENVAKFLYQPFQHKLRYMRLFQLLQKIVIVVTATYVFRSENVEQAEVSLISASVVHFAAFTALFAVKAYILKFEDRVSYMVAFLLAILAITATLILYDIDVPAWFTTVLLVINAAIPALALIAGIFLAFLASKQEQSIDNKLDDMAIGERLEEIVELFKSGKVTAIEAPSMGASMKKSPKGSPRSSRGSNSYGGTPTAPGAPGAFVMPAMPRETFNKKPGAATSNGSSSNGTTAVAVTSSAAAPQSPTAAGTAAGGTEEGGDAPKKKKVVKKVVVKKIVRKKSAAKGDNHGTGDGAEDQQDENESGQFSEQNSTAVSAVTPETEEATTEPAEEKVATPTAPPQQRSGNNGNSKPDSVGSSPTIPNPPPLTARKDSVQDGSSSTLASTNPFIPPKTEVTPPQVSAPPPAGVTAAGTTSGTSSHRQSFGNSSTLPESSSTSMMSPTEPPQGMPSSLPQGATPSMEVANPPTSAARRTSNSKEDTMDGLGDSSDSWGLDDSGSGKEKESSTASPRTKPPATPGSSGAASQTPPATAESSNNTSRILPIPLPLPPMSGGGNAPPSPGQRALAVSKSALDSDDDEELSSASSSDDDAPKKAKKPASGSKSGPEEQRPGTSGAKGPLDADTMNMTLTKGQRPPDLKEVQQQDAPATSGRRAGARTKIIMPEGSPTLKGDVSISPRAAGRQSMSGSFAQDDDTPTGSKRRQTLAERKANFNINDGGRAGGGIRGQDSLASSGKRQSSANFAPNESLELGGSMLGVSPSSASPRTPKPDGGAVPFNPLASRKSLRDRDGVTATAAELNTRRGSNVSVSEEEHSPRPRANSADFVPWSPTHGGTGSVGLGRRSVAAGSPLAGDAAELRALGLSQRRNTAASASTRVKYDVIYFDLLRNKQMVGVSADDALPDLYALAKKEMDEQRDFLKGLIKDADHTINVDVRRYLNVYLVVAAFFMFVALGFSFCGLVMAVNPEVRRPSGANVAVDEQFANYGSFENFTTSCCCAMYELPAPNEAQWVEKWLCSNGAVVERTRVKRSYDAAGNLLSVTDGTRIRPVCNVNFTNPANCGLRYSFSSAERQAVGQPADRVGLACPDPTISQAEKDLW